MCYTSETKTRLTWFVVAKNRLPTPTFLLEEVFLHSIDNNDRPPPHVLLPITEYWTFIDPYLVHLNIKGTCRHRQFVWMSVAFNVINPNGSHTGLPHAHYRFAFHFKCLRLSSALAMKAISPDGGGGGNPLFGRSPPKHAWNWDHWALKGPILSSKSVLWQESAFSTYFCRIIASLVFGITLPSFNLPLQIAWCNFGDAVHF